MLIWINQKTFKNLMFKKAGTFHFQTCLDYFMPIIEYYCIYLLTAI